MFDSLVNDVMAQLAASPHGQSKESVVEQARSKAESGVKRRHEEINKFAREELSYAITSSKHIYIWFLRHLPCANEFRQLETITRTLSKI